MINKVNDLAGFKLNGIGGIVTVFFGFISAKFGSLALPLLLLVGFNLIDYGTAIAAAKYRGEQVESKKGIKGIFKKVLMWSLVFVGIGLDLTISHFGGMIGFKIQSIVPFGVATVVCFWLVFNEAISIIENVETVDQEHVPSFLKGFVKALKRKMEQSAPKVDDEEEKN